MRTKRLLQIVVRPRQIGSVVAGEQAWPVTPAHLKEVIHTRTQVADRIAVPSHGPQQPAELAPDRHRTELHLAEDVGRSMHPPEREIQRRECLAGHFQGPVNNRLQFVQLDREPPFFSARSKLQSMALNRAWSFNPDASKGGRPSSVRALRTAEQ